MIFLTENLMVFYNNYDLFSNYGQAFAALKQRPESIKGRQSRFFMPNFRF
jgi:hypothetical protein